MIEKYIDNRDYSNWLSFLFTEIDKQKTKAVMQINAATLQHYWWLGRDILNKQAQHGWGTKVIDKLSEDLISRYGRESGYSVRNLKYMRKFATEYPDFPFILIPISQLTNNKILNERLCKFTISADGEFVQVPLAQITWYHHISLISKIDDLALRAFYITETANVGWSRDIMLMQIESGYYKKAQSLPNNFSETLPPIHSDLANAAFKDPYNFGFVDMALVKQERDLENQLTQKITDFLLELGKGFSFMGRQYPINICGEEHRIDLLMYHTQLHCYVAIELKVVDFEPEFISKLNFYISAIDDIIKMPQDNPTIGLLLCKSKNNTKVEYALRGNSQPLGVAEYQTAKIIDEIKTSLPTIEDLEKTLDKD